MNQEFSVIAWAAKWGVPPAAIQDLSQSLVAASASERAEREGGSEAWVQSRVLLDAGYRDDILLFRNNVGVLQDINGRPVRYGLANDSARVNQSIKSGDLLGVWRRIIRPQDVGQAIGQFVSIETKRVGWSPRPNDKHEAAQSAWAALINNYGGLARFYAGQGNIFEVLTND